MPVRSTLNVSMSGVGLNISTQKQFSTNGAIPVSRALAAAKAGTLTTRTNDTDGEITGASDHGVITGDVIDMYWTEAGVKGARYGVVVGTVASLAIPISGGAGDVLPTDETALDGLMVQTVTDLIVDGDDLKALVISAAARAIVTLQDAGGVELVHVFDEAGTYVWYFDSGDANPVAADDIILVTMTHADTGATRTVQVLALYD